jgi:hypothetical protein
MKAPYDNYTVDGKMYEKGEEVWDLGDWTATEVYKDGRRHYEGTSDASHLPPYAQDGSEALDLSKADVYKCYKGVWSILGV